MKVIKIDVHKKNVYETELHGDPIQEIRNLIGAPGHETAHKFETGDKLFIDGDGGWNSKKWFELGYKEHGYKKFYGNGVIIHYEKYVYSSTKKSIDQIRSIVRFESKS